MEALRLVGAMGFVASGNALDNRIDGDTGDDSLSGLIGADTLMGAEGADTRRGGPEADHLRGGDDADRLVAEAGIATLEGGAGDDIHEIGAARVSIVEAADGGIDRILLLDALDFTLPGAMEVLKRASAGRRSPAMPGRTRSSAAEGRTGSTARPGRIRSRAAAPATRFRAARGTTPSSRPTRPALRWITGWMAASARTRSYSASPATR